MECADDSESGDRWTDFSLFTFHSYDSRQVKPQNLLFDLLKNHAHWFGIPAMPLARPERFRVSLTDEPGETY